MPKGKPVKFDYTAVQADLESGNYTLDQIAAKYGIEKPSIAKAARLGHLNRATWNVPTYKHTAATKAQMSVAKKALYKAYPEKHNWKTNDKFKSVPCEQFKAMLTDAGVAFVEEYTPLEDRFFSIDVAFPDGKLGIEINGNQHYDEYGHLKPYYQERHDLIKAAGWFLIELHFSVVYNKLLMEQLIRSIKSNRQYSIVDYTPYIRVKKEKVKAPILMANRLKKDEDAVVLKTLVLVSGIDFSSFGWVAQVAKVTGLPHQKVSKWMAQYMPDVYASCFKKKVA